MKTETEGRGRTQAAEGVAEAAAAYLQAAAQASETPTGTLSEWGAKLAARREALKALRAAVARWEESNQPPPPGSREAVIVYTNWKGETAERRIVPGPIWFGSTTWHPAPGFLLRAFDVDKSAVRDFALKDVREWREGGGDER